MQLLTIHLPTNSWGYFDERLIKEVPMKFVGLSPGVCVRNLGGARISAKKPTADHDKQVLDFFAAGGGCCRTSPEVSGYNALTVK